VVGIVLWITVILDSRYPKLFGTSEISSYLTMLLSSLGLIFVISGSGICMSYSIFKPIYEKQGIADAVDGSTTRTALSDRESRLQDYGKRDAGILSSNNVKFGLIAFIQSCLALALFSGLVDEYQSNNSMQQWVSSVFPYGQLVLSWEAVLVASALFGMIVVQFIPGKELAE
jgi:hypothetical protein